MRATSLNPFARGFGAGTRAQTDAALEQLRDRLAPVSGQDASGEHEQPHAAANFLEPPLPNRTPPLRRRERPAIVCHRADGVIVEFFAPLGARARLKGSQAEGLVVAGHGEHTVGAPAGAREFSR